LSQGKNEKVVHNDFFSTKLKWGAAVLSREKNITLYTDKRKHRIVLNSIYYDRSMMPIAINVEKLSVKDDKRNEIVTIVLMIIIVRATIQNARKKLQ